MHPVHKRSPSGLMASGFKLLACVLTFVLILAATVYFNPLWLADQVIRFRLWQQGVHSEYVSVSGYRIHYFEAAPLHGEVGTPLVLIHGLGSRGEDWAAMMPRLAAAGFHVYAPDLPGYGRSDRPDIAYTISDEEKAAADFMRTMRIDHADVAGASMGGWIAAKLTVDHPELVERLALYDAAGVYFTPTYPPSVFTPKDSAGLTRLTSLLSPHPRHLPGFVERAVFTRLQSNAWVINRSLAAMVSGRELLDFRLHSITQPTLIVWGSVDTLIPPASGEVMHRAIPQSVLTTVTGCGHLAPVECSDAVTKATIDFFNAQPAPARGEATVPGSSR